MKEYTVKMIFLGQKVSAKVKADTSDEAKQKVIDRLVFVSVQENGPAVEQLKQMFNMK